MKPSSSGSLADSGESCESGGAQELESQPDESASGRGAEEQATLPGIESPFVWFARMLTEVKQIFPHLTVSEANVLRKILDELHPPKQKATTDQIQAVFAHYQTYHVRAKLSDKQRTLIRARLNDGYTVDDLHKSIDGLHRDPFYNGENDRGKTYLRIGLAMDPDKISGFIEMADADLTVISEMNRRGMRAAQTTDLRHLLEPDTDGDKAK